MYMKNPTFKNSRSVRLRTLTLLFGIFQCCLLQPLHAQVGIAGSAITPDASAMLEVLSANKGVLVPRVALTGAADATTIASPATSLFVYNTGTAGLTPAGYYYNAGTPAVPNWVKLAIMSDLSASTQLWQDNTTYISPTAATGATYPYIYDNNTATVNNGNATQFYYYIDGGNTEAGIYVYSSQNAAGTSNRFDESRACIKAYDLWGDNFNPAIGGYSYLDYDGSSGIYGGKYDGTSYTKLGCQTSGNEYAAEMNGDFYNQDINYGQSTTTYGGADFSLRTQAVTTHGTGTALSAVWIHGEVDYYKTGTDSYVVFRIYRDGTFLGEVSEVSFINEDKTIHIQWFDEPTAGNHTYEIKVYYPSGGMTYYGHQLHVVEIKR